MGHVVLPLPRMFKEASWADEPLGGREVARAGAPGPLGLASPSRAGQPILGCPVLVGLVSPTRAGQTQWG